MTMSRWNSTLIQGETVSFDQNTAATHTIFTPATGERFIVTRVFLYFAAQNNVTFRSASNDLTGDITFPAGSYLELGSDEEFVWKGDATGEAFTVVLGQAQQVSGFFTVATEDR